MEFEGNPISQGRPRLGKYRFYNPNSRIVKAFKAKIKEELPYTPIFDSNQPDKVLEVSQVTGMYSEDQINRKEVMEEVHGS